MRKTLLIFIMLLGVFSCEEEESDELRMRIAETGCANPWEMRGEGEAYINHIKGFLFDQKILVLRIEIKDELPDGVTPCESCFCWTGRNVYIIILPDQQDEAEELGFTIVEG